MNFCGSCGEKVDENALVCSKCGTPQKSVAQKDKVSTFEFKKPDEYEEDSAEADFESIKVESSAPPPSWKGGAPEGEVVRLESISSGPVTMAVEDDIVEEKTAVVEEEKPGEHSCTNCSGALIYSLARGFWFCPACGTEARNLPSPYGDEDEEDEAETAADHERADQGPSGMPAGAAGAGWAGEQQKLEKPPDEVDGVSRDKAKESIIEVQNLLENKVRTGVYSVEAETSFESMKVAFTEFNYPAVIMLNTKTREIIARAESAEDLEDKARAAEAMLPGGKRQQAINALQSSKGLILEAEKLGYDLMESKKIYKQAEPAYRAGDYDTAINFAHDVEESVNTVLGGKRLAKAPSYQPRQAGAPGYAGEVRSGQEQSWFAQNRDIIFKYVFPIGGLLVLIIGASLAYISYVDNIWNPFSDGPDDWGPYNTVGVILGIVAVIVGLLFAVLPFLVTKKIYVRMEPPKPMQMR